MSGPIQLNGITLRDGEVVLRPMTESDWGALLKWNGDPEVLYFTEGVEGQRYDIDIVHKIYRGLSREGYVFIIEFEDEPVGECFLQKMNLERVLRKFPDKDIRRIGIMIGEKSLWGRGIGTRTIWMLAGFGFMKEGSDILFTDPFEDNVRSIRACLKVGFVMDGTFDSMPYGKSHYSIDMILTKERYLDLMKVKADEQRSA